MRIKVLRNVGIQTVREFAEKGLTLDQLQEGQVLEADGKVAEALIARTLAEQTTDEVTKTKVKSAAEQPADSKFNELSRPAAGTGHEAGGNDPNNPEPGRQAGTSQTGTGDHQTRKK